MLTIKKRLRKWLGVVSLEELLDSHDQRIAECWSEWQAIDERHDRLENMYGSNRMRIDTLTARLDKTDVIVAQLRLFGLPTSVLQKPKRGRPAKKTTTPKKGK